MSPQFLAAAFAVLPYYAAVYRADTIAKGRIVASTRLRFAQQLAHAASYELTRESSMWAAQLLDASLAFENLATATPEALAAVVQKLQADKARERLQARMAAGLPVAKHKLLRARDKKKDGTPRKPRAKRIAPERTDVRQELPGVVAPDGQQLVAPKQATPTRNTSMFAKCPDG